MFYLFIADGTEEVEAIAALDVIRRAGIEIQTVGVGSSRVAGSHGVCIVCDITENEIQLSEKLEGVILPGGMPGTLNLENSKSVQEAIDYCSLNGKLLCAICAAPSILGHKGLLKGRRAVCFPGFEKDLEGAVLSDSFVERDGNVVTAKGMGSALAFGLEIVSAVKGQDTADRLKGTLQCFI